MHATNDIRAVVRSNKRINLLKREGDLPGGVTVIVISKFAIMEEHGLER